MSFVVDVDEVTSNVQSQGDLVDGSLQRRVFDQVDIRQLRVAAWNVRLALEEIGWLRWLDV